MPEKKLEFKDMIDICEDKTDDQGDRHCTFKVNGKAWQINDMQVFDALGEFSKKLPHDTKSDGGYIDPKKQSMSRFNCSNWNVQPAKNTYYHIIDLNLADNDLGDLGVEALFTWLKYWGISCEIIQLYKNKFGNYGAYFIADYIAASSPIYEIHLTDCYMANEGIGYIFRALAENESYPQKVEQRDSRNSNRKGKKQERYGLYPLWLRIQNNCVRDAKKFYDKQDEELKKIRQKINPNFHLGPSKSLFKILDDVSKGKSGGAFKNYEIWRTYDEKSKSWIYEEGTGVSKDCSEKCENAKPVAHMLYATKQRRENDSAPPGVQLLDVRRVLEAVRKENASNRDERNRLDNLSGNTKNASSTRNAPSSAWGSANNNSNGIGKVQFSSLSADQDAQMQYAKTEASFSSSPGDEEKNASTAGYNEFSNQLHDKSKESKTMPRIQQPNVPQGREMTPEEAKAHELYTILDNHNNLMICFNLEDLPKDWVYVASRSTSKIYYWNLEKGFGTVELSDVFADGN